MTVSQKQLYADYTNLNGQSQKDKKTYVVGGTLTGSATPRWKSKLASFSSATSVMSAFEQDLVIHQPVRTRTTQVGAPTFVGSSVDERFAWHVPAVLDTSLIGLTQAGVNSKFYKELSSDFKALTTLGELRESVALIRGSALRLRGLVDKNYRAAWTKRAAARSVSDWRRVASDLWLEYAFGWKPLISDIGAGYKAFNKHCDGSKNKTIAVTYRNSSSSPQSLIATQPVIGSSAMTSQVYMTTRYDCSCSYKVGYTYNVSSDAAHRQFSFGVSPSDLIVTGWELLPWSFLVDYFVNVGAILDAKAVASAIDIAWTSRTTRLVRTSEITTQTSRTAGADASYRPTLLSEGSASFMRKQISRDLHKPFIPHFRFSSKLSTSQGLNIAALISSQRRDRGYGNTGN